MSTILDASKTKIKSSKSVLAVERPDDGWVRYLTIEGKQAYTIGVICGTCRLIFKRMDGANQTISAEKLADALADGITKLNRKVMRQVSALMPVGNYRVSLLKISSKLVELGSDADYFANEQTKLWGVDPFWGLAHYPKVKYYRSPTTWTNENREFFELVFPMVPPHWLDMERVEYYEELIRSGIAPTAIAISFLDVMQPQDLLEYPKIDKHECLIHLLIDGHHKIYAASKLGIPITLLSFLAVDESVATEDEINKVLETLSENP